MKNIIKSRIVCPKCKSVKEFSFTESIINADDFLASVFFTKGNICEHQFNAYIDIHGNVRGYQLINFVVPSFQKKDSQLKPTFKKDIESKDN